MLVIYRTNKDFEGDVVTIMDGALALAAAMVSENTAVLEVDLGTEQSADLRGHPETYAVRDPGTGPELYRRAL